MEQKQGGWMEGVKCSGGAGSQSCMHVHALQGPRREAYTGVRTGARERADELGSRRHKGQKNQRKDGRGREGIEGEKKRRQRESKRQERRAGKRSRGGEPKWGR